MKTDRNWIQLAEVKDEQWSFCQYDNKHTSSIIRVNFLTSCVVTNFSTKILHHKIVHEQVIC
jgi:hypothetical protein